MSVYRYICVCIYVYAFICVCVCVFRGCLHGILVFGREVSEFELQSRYYVNFQTDTLEKGINLLILTAMG